jgi:deoxyribodipyrimidine photolyase-related protein
MPYHQLALILGNQLFPNHAALQPSEQTLFFMAEDVGLCTHFKYHKHKLMLFLSAMRSHAEEVGKQHALRYWHLTADNRSLLYEDKLAQTLDEQPDIREIVTYVIEDKFFAERVQTFCQKKGLKLTIVDSPLFLNSVSDFREYLNRTKRPFMQYFYIEQRKQRGILIDQQQEPVGGKWSLDAENRKKLPRDISIPSLAQSEATEHTQAVAALVNELFADHPGDTADFWLATTRRQALYRLQDFLKNRFEDFGPYEDAIDRDGNFLFHSVLSPYLNLGLITPDEVVTKALDYAADHGTHFPSVEGYVRQVIGWREFMRGMYHTHELRGNFFGHRRQLNDHWYAGTTGVPPLDDSIRRVVRHGYTHHIERLMVLGNIMLLSEVHPDAVYGWFMEMFVDSSDWVMVPNVYGMSQFADGGTFATKPYIGGANYIAKMSNYAKSGQWVDEVDGLYWRFIDQHRKVFAANQRMSMMLGTLERMDADRKERLFRAAEGFLARNTG